MVEKNAVFQEIFMFTLLQGIRDFEVAVWNSSLPHLFLYN